MTEFEKQCYGMSTADIREQYGKLYCQARWSGNGVHEHIVGRSGIAGDGCNQ